MLSTESIEQESRRAARLAAERDMKPFTVWAEDLRKWKGGRCQLPFPALGSYKPKGYKLVDTLFVDSSGFGSENEPALTYNQLINRLVVGRGYAILKQGQFQCYVGEFVRKS
jgi:hypothetical protein